MPSVYTHQLFGQEVLFHLAQTTCFTQDMKDAFAFGCQGPDPFFFSFGWKNIKKRKLGISLHKKHFTEAIDAMFHYYHYAKPAEQAVLSSYISGYLCHYALDSVTHPYVEALQTRIYRTRGNTGDYGYLHCKIETDIDVLLIEQKLGIPLNKQSTASFLYKRSGVTRIIDALYCYVAKKVYACSLPSNAYTASLSNMITLEKIIRSPRNQKRKFLITVEKTLRKKSYFEAISHASLTSDPFDLLNAKRQIWGTCRLDHINYHSFTELFEGALTLSLHMIHAFQNHKRAYQITENISFAGISEKTARHE